MIRDQDGDSIPGELQTRLEAELDRLKSMFQRGHHLKLVTLPGKLRYGVNGGLLSGEVQNGTIIIYEAEEGSALQTLYHEFIEAVFIYPLVRDCYDVLKYQQTVIAMQKEVIHKFLMGRKEDTVNGISKPLCVALAKDHNSK